jgi:hypothetical protein
VAAALQIAEVVLVAVGFLLETDVEVGQLAVTVFEEQEEPLQDIPEEEGQVEQLALLGSMDEFMVELDVGEWPPAEDKTKEAYRIVVATQEEPADAIYLVTGKDGVGQCVSGLA